MHRIYVTAALVALALVLRVVSSTSACATVSRPNQPVRFADQSVIIWWDAVNKVEHFVRQAAFEAQSKDFGFIVPTPTKPELAEAKTSAFAALEALTAPKTEWRWSFQAVVAAFWPSFKMSARLDDGSAQSKVRVLEQKRVSGFDAAVLEADDADALAAWLKDHGYSARPELTKWLDFYVAKKWKVTAFKIAHDPATGTTANTAPVRMSFPTEQPFFPYRVPDEADPQGRLLRIFFVSGGRVAGKLGDGKAWSGRPVWADRLEQPQSAALARDLGLGESFLPKDAWLTAFDDPYFPRPGNDDVWFDLEPSQGALHRPPLVRTVWIPLDVVLVVGGLVTWGVIARRKRGAASRGASAPG